VEAIAAPSLLRTPVGWSGNWIAPTLHAQNPTAPVKSDICTKIRRVEPSGGGPIVWAHPFIELDVPGYLLGL